MQDVLAYFSQNGTEFVQMVATHLWLSAVALALATVIAVPLGILGARFRRLDSVSEGVWGTLRIIPSLALLLVLIPVLGTGTLPAVVSLTVLAITHPHQHDDRVQDASRGRARGRGGHGHAAGA